MFGDRARVFVDGREGFTPAFDEIRMRGLIHAIDDSVDVVGAFRVDVHAHDQRQGVHEYDVGLHFAGTNADDAVPWIKPLTRKLRGTAWRVCIVSSRSRRQSPAS